MPGQARTMPAGAGSPAEPLRSDYDSHGQFTLQECAAPPQHTPQRVRYVWGAQFDERGSIGGEWGTVGQRGGTTSCLAPTATERGRALRTSRRRHGLGGSSPSPLHGRARGAGRTAANPSANALVWQPQRSARAPGGAAILHATSPPANEAPGLWVTGSAALNPQRALAARRPSSRGHQRTAGRALCSTTL